MALRGHFLWMVVWTGLWVAVWVSEFGLPGSGKAELGAGCLHADNQTACWILFSCQAGRHVLGVGLWARCGVGKAELGAGCWHAENQLVSWTLCGSMSQSCA